MSTKRSVAGILGNLESEIARLEKEEAFHAQQEAAHREKRAASAERLALVRERYQAFRSASAAVEEVVPASAEPEDAKAPTSVIRQVARIVAAKAPDEPFTPSGLLAEVQQRSPKLAASNRNVSAALRRLVERGEVRVVEEGKPYHEAVYERGERGARGARKRK